MTFQQTALMNCDSYKLAHADMFPIGTTKVYSNFTPRSDHYFNAPESYKDGKIVWFGMQAFLVEMNEVWDKTFFLREWEEVEEEFGSFVVPFAGPNGFNMSRIKELHDLGYLPLLFKALPEATLVPIGVPVMTVTNTHPRFPWLPNYMESWLSCDLWKATTSATTARLYKKILKRYAEITGGATAFIPVQAHDFSLRGMSGISDGAKCGAGHLLSFIGTDNLPAVKLINDVYRGKDTFVGCSVPASEHSVTTSSILAMGDGASNVSETEFFRRMVTDVYPSGIVSLVADSFDFWSVITSTAPALKKEIMSRMPDSMGFAKVVFRPDSGDPVRILCGDPIYDFDSLKKLDIKNLDDVKNLSLNVIVSDVANATVHGKRGVNSANKIFKYDGKIYMAKANIIWSMSQFEDLYFIQDSMITSFDEIELTPEQKGAVQCLWETFGGTTNSIGYKTLDSHVGLIYGDSITLERCDEILRQLADKGFASDNVVFGVGSYTYNMVSRDTLGFAMKATFVEVDGVGIPVYKDPKTSDGTKRSARGLLRVDSVNGEYTLTDNVDSESEASGELVPVYCDGGILCDEKFAELRERLENSL